MITMTPKRILLATDLSCRCDRALDRAAALAAEWGARLVVVHAIERPAPVSNAPSWRRPIDPREAAMQRILADLREPGALDLELVVERGEPAQLVLDTAARRGAELIVTGVARDETLGRALLGSTVDALSRRARAPVLAVRSRPRGPYRDVVVATDFSEDARRALVTTLELFPAARVRLYHAYQVVYEGFIEDKMSARDGSAQRAQAEAREHLAGIALAAGREISTLVEHGPPEIGLRELVLTRGVELVVAGTRGRGRVATLFLGSVAKELLASLPGDVLIVPRGEPT